MKRKHDISHFNGDIKKKKGLDFIELEIAKLSSRYDGVNDKEIDDIIQALNDAKNRTAQTYNRQSDIVFQYTLPDEIVVHILSFYDFMLHRHYNALSNDDNHQYALHLFFGFFKNDSKRSIRMLFPSITFATHGNDIFSFDLFLYDVKAYRQTNDQVPKVLSQALPCAHITSLNLSGQRGHIAHNLLDYANLTSLDISNTINQETELVALLLKLSKIRHLVVTSPEDSSCPSEFLKLFEDVEMDDLRSLQLEFNSYEEWDNSDTEQFVDLLLHFTTIERLRLVDVFSNDTSAINNFINLPNLKVLELHASSYAPVIDARSLLKNKNLRDVSLYGFEVQNADELLGSDQIAVLSIEIHNSNVLSAISRRSDPSSLKSLDFFHSNFGNTDIAVNLNKLQDLRSLEMRNLDASWLLKTSLHSSLVNLILPECNCSDELLLRLSQAPKLKLLSLEHSCNITITGIKALSRHPTLTNLELAGALGDQVDDALRYLITNTTLQALDVSSNNSSDPDVLTLMAANDTLTMLDVRDMTISETALKALFILNTSLTSLYIGGPMELSYDRHFVRMNTNLTDLYIEGMHVDNLHVALARCSHLQMVWLQPQET